MNNLTFLPPYLLNVPTTYLLEVTLYLNLTNFINKCYSSTISITRPLSHLWEGSLSRFKINSTSLDLLIDSKELTDDFYRHLVFVL
jgi:hypothetical protein